MEEVLLKVIEALMEQNRFLTEKLVGASVQGASPSFVPTHSGAVASGPLHISEAEEDVKYARDAGLISEEEARDTLAQLGFENSEIQFA